MVLFTKSTLNTQPCDDDGGGGGGVIGGISGGGGGGGRDGIGGISGGGGVIGGISGGAGGGGGGRDGIGGISGGGGDDDAGDSEKEASCNLLLITVKEGSRPHFTKSTLERDDEESFWSLTMNYKCDQEKR